MKNQKIICTIAAVALMVAAVFCGYRIYSHYAQVDEQTEVFDELAAVVESTLTEDTQAGFSTHRSIKLFSHRKRLNQAKFLHLLLYCSWL